MQYLASGYANWFAENERTIVGVGALFVRIARRRRGFNEPFVLSLVGGEGEEEGHAGRVVVTTL